MIKLIVAVRRKAGLSVEEFHEHWRTVHARLIRNTPVCRQYIRRYVQCHTIPEEYAAGEPAYDGTAELWFDTLTDKDAFFSDPEYLANIRPDELSFADLTLTRFFATCEEPVLP